MINRDAKTPSQVPGFWSFGSIPRASSEGFLDPFTPRVWRIQISPLYFLSEYFSKVTHRFLGFIAPLSEEVTTLRSPPVRIRKDSLQTNEEELQEVRLRPPAGSFYSKGISTTPEGPKLKPVEIYQGEVLGIDLMNPRPQGILVSLKPTEEGPLGKAEIPENRTREDFIISLFLKTLSVVR